jgi:hypothetical protein
MKQTAVDWLFQQLWEAPKDKLTWHSILEKAKQMENKQTAVEWLVEKIQQGNPSFKFDALIRQAKEMEKEQIKDAHLLGLIHSLEMEATKQAEQYYNENYKSE